MMPGSNSKGPRLIYFDTSVLFSMLDALDAPAAEADLLRAATGERRLPSGRERLFDLHFSFFHALYRLKSEAGAKGYYLHLDPMRIRLARVPGPGLCRYYDPSAGLHCGSAADDAGHCGQHSDPGNSAALFFDPLRDFYTNPENISFGESAVLDRLMKGAVIYALRRGEVERALAVFGLQRPTMKSIKKRYHELARALHPDLHPGSESLMKELNHSYQVLMEIFVI